MPPQQFTTVQSTRGLLPGKEILPSGTPRKFLTFSSLLFLATLLIYIGLSAGYKGFLNSEIKNTKEEIEELRFQISADQQDDIVKFFSQVANMEDILDEHVIASKLFPILEESTHSKVAYLSMEVEVPDRKITVDGIAESYDALVSQMAIYESFPQIESVILEESERRGNIVDFKVIITVVPGTFDFTNT
jgi:hypothetical protein